MRKTLAPEIHARAQERALQIFAVEAKINEALVANATLLAGLAQDGREAGVHISADHKLIAANVALTEALSVARGRSIEMHDQAAVLARAFQIDITAGDPGVKPPNAEAIPPMMRVVRASEAA